MPFNTLRRFAFTAQTGVALIQTIFERCSLTGFSHPVLAVCKPIVTAIAKMELRRNKRNLCARRYHYCMTSPSTTTEKAATVTVGA